MAGDSITPLGVPGAYTDYSNYMMNPYMMNSYMSPYMNPYMMNGSSAAMMGMGYYNPSFYGQWMREMNQLNAQMEKDKLAHTTDMHALTQQAEVQNMSIHDRTFFEKAMVDGDMAKDIRNLAEVVRSGDQDAICEEYDKIKRSVLTKYSDFFSTSQGRINVTDKVNDYICDIYSEYVKKWTGQPADLRQDIKNYGETAFMHGFNSSFFKKSGYHERYTEQTLNHCFGTRIDNKEGKDRMAKIGGGLGCFAEGATATAGGLAAGAAAGAAGGGKSGNVSSGCGHHVPQLPGSAADRQPGKTLPLRQQLFCKTSRRYLPCLQPDGRISHAGEGGRRYYVNC